MFSDQKLKSKSWIIEENLITKLNKWKKKMYSLLLILNVFFVNNLIYTFFLIVFFLTSWEKIENVVAGLQSFYVCVFLIFFLTSTLMIGCWMVQKMLSKSNEHTDPEESEAEE